jgi:hypothetical protein
VLGSTDFRIGVSTTAAATGRPGDSAYLPGRCTTTSSVPTLASPTGTWPMAMLVLSSGATTVR